MAASGPQFITDFAVLSQLPPIDNKSAGPEMITDPEVLRQLAPAKSSGPEMITDPGVIDALRAPALFSADGRFRIIDGDTVEDTQAAGRPHLRLKGINTSETGRTSAAGAKALLKQYLDAAGVNVNYKLTGSSDDYKRPIAEFYSGQESINQKMVASGFAASDDFGGTSGKYAGAADQANMAFRGMTASRTPEQVALKQTLDEAATKPLDERYYQERPTRAPTLLQDAGSGLRQGTDQLQADAYAVTALFGDALGSEDVRKWGLEGYKRNHAEAAENAPSVQDFTSVLTSDKPVGDFFHWAFGALGQAMPSLATMVVGGGIGAIAARKGVQMATGKGAEELMRGHVTKKAVDNMIERGVPRGVAERVISRQLRENPAVHDAMARGLVTQAGAVAGVYATSSAQQMGSIYGELDDAGIRAPGTAAAFGAAGGALDALGPLYLMRQLFPGVGADVAKSIVRRVAKTGGVELLIEGNTEGAQEVIALAARAHEDPNFKVWTPENRMRVYNAAAAGALVGAVAGGLGGVATPGPNGQVDETYLNTPPAVVSAPQEDGIRQDQIAADIPPVGTPPPGEIVQPAASGEVVSAPTTNQVPVSEELVVPPALGVQVRELALQAQRHAGWNTDWPFVPADLGNADFRKLIAEDPGISEQEKTQIFAAGEKLGVVPKNGGAPIAPQTPIIAPQTPSIAPQEAPIALKAEEAPSLGGIGDSLNTEIAHTQVSRDKVMRGFTPDIVTNWRTGIVEQLNAIVRSDPGARDRFKSAVDTLQTDRAKLAARGSVLAARLFGLSPQTEWETGMKSGTPEHTREYYETGELNKYGVGEFIKFLSILGKLDIKYPSEAMLTAHIAHAVMSDAKTDLGPAPWENLPRYTKPKEEPAPAAPVPAMLSDPEPLTPASVAQIVKQVIVDHEAEKEQKTAAITSVRDKLSAKFKTKIEGLPQKQREAMEVVPDEDEVTTEPQTVAAVAEHGSLQPYELTDRQHGYGSTQEPWKAEPDGRAPRGLMKRLGQLKNAHPESSFEPKRTGDGRWVIEETVPTDEMKIQDEQTGKRFTESHYVELMAKRIIDTEGKREREAVEKHPEDYVPLRTENEKTQHGNAMEITKLGLSLDPTIPHSKTGYYQAFLHGLSVLATKFDRPMVLQVSAKDQRPSQVLMDSFSTEHPAQSAPNTGRLNPETVIFYSKTTKAPITLADGMTSQALPGEKLAGVRQSQARTNTKIIEASILHQLARMEYLSAEGTGKGQLAGEQVRKKAAELAELVDRAAKQKMMAKALREKIARENLAGPAGDTVMKDGKKTVLTDRQEVDEHGDLVDMEAEAANPQYKLPKNKVGRPQEAASLGKERTAMQMARRVENKALLQERADARAEAARDVPPDPEAVVVGAIDIEGPRSQDAAIAEASRLKREALERKGVTKVGETITDNEHSMIKALASLAGLKVDITIVDEKGLKQLQDEGHPMSDELHKIESSDTPGRVLFTPRGRGAVIFVSKKATGARRIAVYAHELGHISHLAAFDTLSAAHPARVKLVEAYTRDLVSGRAGNKGFYEWYANQFVAWVARREAPSSIVEKFFKDVFTTLQRLWTALTKRYKLNLNFGEFMDQVVADSLTGRHELRVLGEMTPALRLRIGKDEPLNFPAWVDKNKAIEFAKGTTQDTGKLLHGFAKAVLLPTDSVLRGIRTKTGELYKPASLLANILKPRPGKRVTDAAEQVTDHEGNVIDHGYHDEVTRVTGTFVQAAERIMRRVHAKFDKIPRKDREAAIKAEHERLGELLNRNLSDAELGAASPEALALRKIPEGMQSYLKKAMPEMKFLKNYWTRVFDQEYLEAHRDEFVAMLVNHWQNRGAKVTVDRLHEDAEAIYGKIMDDGGFSFDLREDADSERSAMAPGFKFLRERGLKDVPAELMAPFLSKNLTNTMASYIKSAVKRAEMDRRAGRYEEGIDGERVWNPTSVLDKTMARARKDLEPSEYARLVKNFGASRGTLSYNLDADTRRALARIQAYQNYRTLLFPTISSIPDLGSAVARARTVKGSFGALQDAMKALVDSHKGNRGWLVDMADSMALLQESATNQSIREWSGTGDSNDPKAARANDLLFKYNGLHYWTQIVRVMALVMGKQYLVRHAEDKSARSTRYLRDLGLTAKDVLDWKKGEFKVWGLGNMEDANAELISKALTKFVNEAAMRPDGSMRPAWANDPRLVLFWHLKSFMYAFHQTFIMGTYNEMKARREEGGGVLDVSMPALAMVSVLAPLAMAALALRNLLQHELWGTEPTYSPLDAWEILQRAGGLGYAQLAVDMDEAEQHGGLAFLAAFGPSVSQFEGLVSKPFGNWAAQSVPLLGQIPAFRTFVTGD